MPTAPAADITCKSAGQPARWPALALLSDSKNPKKMVFSLLIE